MDETVNEKEMDGTVEEVAIWKQIPELVSVPQGYEYPGQHKPSDIWPGSDGYPSMDAKVKEFIDKSFLVARPLTPRELQSAINELFKGNITSIMAGNGFSYKVPARTSKLMTFQAGIGLVLKKDCSTVYDFKKNPHKTLGITCILHTICEAVQEDLPVSHRWAFYRHDEILGNAKFASERIYDVSCMLNCRLPSLYVIPESKGCVYGALSMRLKNGREIICSDLIEGFQIPSDLSQIDSFFNMEAECIVVVEKKSFFRHLIRTYCKEHKVILVTGGGVPDVATRAFLRRLQVETKLQVYCMVDPDPFGVMILFIYAFGSISLSFDNLSLAVPSIVWVEISVRDLLKAGVPKRCFSQMTKSEVKMLKNLLEHKYLDHLIPDEWRNAMVIMGSNRIKATIESACHKELSCLGKKIVPSKFKKLGKLKTHVTRRAPSQKVALPRQDDVPEENVLSEELYPRDRE